MNEIWKTIEDYPNYMVSNMGNVKSIAKTKDGIILKPSTDGNGREYLKVKLYKNGVSKTLRIHRLVCAAFIDDFSEEMEIDHLNGLCWDNRLENLKPCNHKENCNNPNTKCKCKGMLGKHGTDNPNSKKILQYSKKGKLIKKWDSMSDAENATNINQGNISNCCNGERGTAGGYIWKYYDLETYLIGIMNNNLKYAA